MAIEVVLGTALLGWAMLSLPQSMGEDIKAVRGTCCVFWGSNMAPCPSARILAKCSASSSGGWSAVPSERGQHSRFR